MVLDLSYRVFQSHHLEEKEMVLEVWSESQQAVEVETALYIEPCLRNLIYSIDYFQTIYKVHTDLYY